MSEKLYAPRNVTAEPKNCAVLVSWSAVDGADGYALHFYKSDEPDVCIKKRLTQSLSKQIEGLTNGTEYFVTVHAFCYKKGREIEGEASERIRFVPISEVLRAQNVLCLDVGEIKTLKWECRNQRPMAHFRTDNSDIVAVGAGGLVKGLAPGTAYVTISAANERFTTKVVVGRGREQYANNAVLMFTGDIMCAVNHQRAAEKQQFDFHDSFNGIRDILRSADLSVGVLEGTFYDRAAYEYEELRLETGEPNSNAPSSFLPALSNAGFGMLVTATNQNCVAGYEGLTATVECIKRLGMDNLGTLGCDPVVRTIKGIRVGFVATTMISNGLEDNISQLKLPDDIGKYTREYFKSLVDKARSQGAEFIVAYQHWGGMNSRSIRPAQIEEAQYMADCGADLIIGSHPHIIQEFRYIRSGGRRVPCAFSLGNFLTTQRELPENRDGMILRLELSRKSGKVVSTVSYIPTSSFDFSEGAAVRPVYPVYSDDSQLSFERIKEHLGKAINHHAYRPLVALSGSVILERILRSSNKFRIDKNPMLLSQISACTGESESIGGLVGSVRLDIEKSLPDYLQKCGAEYLAVDFYSAAALSCYKRGNNLYTGVKRFLNSEFYLANKQEFKRIKPPFSARLWKPAVARYAEAVLKAFPPERIVLFRQHFSDRTVAGNTLRHSEVGVYYNRQIAEMEEFFISLVKPAVVDLSKYYFNTGSSPSDFEREYYYDAANAFEQITRGRQCVVKPDLDLWYDRVMRYYRSMTASSQQRWLLNMRSAADMLIAYTNEAFTAAYRDRLMSLKKRGESSLHNVKSFFADDPGAADIIDAAELIQAVLSGDTKQPYDVYAPAFRNKYNILKVMAKLLSAELHAPVDSESAELVFLLRGKPKLLKSYIRGLTDMTVDVWGSDISKDIVARCDNAVLGRYIAKQSPLLSYEALMPYQVPQDAAKFSGNSWRRKSTEDAFNRNGLFTVINSSSKWLMMDLYDVVCEMCELRGGLFEVDEQLKETDFYKEIESECTSCYLFEKRSMKYCHDTLIRFARDISERYGSNIILVRTDLKDKYMTLGDKLEDFENDPLLAAKRKFITLCEDLFIQVTDCCVIDISKFYHASDAYPRGGAHIVHYEDEFYSLAARCLSSIIRGDSRRQFNKADEKHILLRNLRIGRE
ncbi:MAG: CapA family protein [Oscillospiraceae bacterium]|nr:CapA family protein [Oscillospiraceae bacterium]